MTPNLLFYSEFLVAPPEMKSFPKKPTEPKYHDPQDTQFDVVIILMENDRKKDLYRLELDAYRELRDAALSLSSKIVEEDQNAIFLELCDWHLNKGFASFEAIDGTLYPDTGIELELVEQYWNSYHKDWRNIPKGSNGELAGKTLDQKYRTALRLKREPVGEKQELNPKIMKSKIAQAIIDETPEDVRKKVREYGDDKVKSWEKEQPKEVWKFDEDSGYWFNQDHTKINSSNPNTKKDTDCQCEDSTGWTTVKCCNICGKSVEPNWKSVEQPKRRTRKEIEAVMEELSKTPYMEIEDKWVIQRL